MRYTKPARNEREGFEWGSLQVDDLGFLSDGEGEPVISGRPMSDWIDEFGLPLHLVYRPILVENVRAFKKVFEEHYSNGHMRFAGKVNAHPSVFSIMAEEGVGADVVSPNEMRAALEGGIPATDLDVNGNAKSDHMIDEALSRGMFLIADSRREMEIINARAREMGVTAPVALRVAGFDMQGVTDANIFTAGVWSKFGENISEIPAVLDSLDELKNVDVHGFHTHIGSQVTDPSAYHEVLGSIVELSHMLEEKGGNCRLLNMGGGFPSDYVSRREWEYLENRVREGYIAGRNGRDEDIFVWNNAPGGLATKPDGSVAPELWSGERMYSRYPREEMLKEVLTGSVKVNGKTVPFRKALEELGAPKLVIEPGRSVAEGSGVTLIRVAHVRPVAGKHWLTTLEGSVTSFATAMLLPPVNSWTVMTDPHSRDDEPFECFLAGQLCYSGDIISRYKVFLQRRPARGDVLCCYHTGAYDPSFFAANTNSFPRPARVLTDADGTVAVIKRRDTYDEIFSVGNCAPEEGEGN